MAKFQLIVKGNSGKYSRGDSVVIPLDATTLAEAHKEAKWNLRGDPYKWKGSFRKSYSGKMEFAFSLDPDDNVAVKGLHGVLLDNEEDVYDATIVEIHESLDVDQLRQDIENAKVKSRKAAEQDPDYQEYLRLQQRFG